jgi:hypothetical protein
MQQDEGYAKQLDGHLQCPKLFAGSNEASHFHMHVQRQMALSVRSHRNID